MLLFSICCVLAASGRRLDDGVLNNQALAPVRDKIVGKLELTISRMNATSYMSADDLLKALTETVMGDAQSVVSFATPSSIERGISDEVSQLLGGKKRPASLTLKKKLPVSSAPPPSPAADADDEAVTDDAPTSLLLNNTMLSQIRDRLVSQLEVEISHMNSTATTTRSELLSEMLSKITDIIGPISGQKQAAAEADDADDDDDDEKIALPKLARPATFGGRVHPALAYVAGLASGVAIAVAVFTVRQRRGKGGFAPLFGGVGEQGLSESILSREEQLARI
jgi:hypothetical protein